MAARAGLWFLVALTGGWLWFLGVLAAGEIPNVQALVLVVTPLICLLIVAFCARSLNAFGKAESMALLIICVSAYPLFRQPWNPRNNFVSALNSVPLGTSASNVVKYMRPYFYSGVYKAGPRDKGATHVMSFQWNRVDGNYNADFGRVLLKDGRVVGTDFSPD